MSMMMMMMMMVVVVMETGFCHVIINHAMRALKA